MGYMSYVSYKQVKYAQMHICYYDLMWKSSYTCMQSLLLLQYVLKLFSQVLFAEVSVWMDVSLGATRFSWGMFDLGQMTEMLCSPI